VSQITWDKYSLQIDNKKIFLLGGEFHYWRVPDRERWEDILKMYKTAGLNCIRIYFHWGYHNPAEGNFYFSENRDVDYLLNLCEDIGLYVFVAQGPYICAEANAGGFPGWLLAKRKVRIRHMKGLNEVEYDPEYMKYCRSWYKEIISHLKPHQITENPNGCIIGFQIENEYHEGGSGLRRYIEELVQYAHEFGITVPTFHNDVMEAGSWNGLVDLCAFDKYPVWAATSLKEGVIPQWKTGNFSLKIDKIEKKVRSFGGEISKSPIFIPELQGGWFNHWGIPYGYDELYNFYGSTFQKTILNSLAAQGVSIMVLYMFYGGTTWGSVPGPEVYTSYDYSSAIREFGYQSNRLRHVRLFSLFVQSFKESFLKSDYVMNPSIGCNIKKVFLRQRHGLDGTDYYFFRNFNKEKIQDFKILLSNGIQIPTEGTHKLDPRDSYIAIGNHEINGFFILFCSLNIIIKGNYADGTLFVLIQNGGELLLNGTEFDIKGDIKKHIQDNFTRFSFPKKGKSCIISPKGKKFFIICIAKEEALTLNADFSETDLRLAWGVYSLLFTNKNTLEIETFSEHLVWLLSNQVSISNFSEVKDSIIPGLKTGRLGSSIKIPEVTFEKWYRLKTNWSNKLNQKVWKIIDINTERDPIDHHFTCGHVLYMCEFVNMNEEQLTLTISSRHKTAIWLNNHFIGGHETYSLHADEPGAMNGRDPPQLGTQSYDLLNINKSEPNVLFIITENLGHNKMFYGNDVRNPRGILSAKFSSKLNSEEWYISGINTTELEQAYNTAGLPGEKSDYHLGKGENWIELQQGPTISPEDQIVWYKTKFKWKIETDKRMPLRINIQGKHNVHIFLNGMYIGNYWGAYGPQHDFYLMDKLLKEDNILVLACWTTERDQLTISIKPYSIKKNSGNIDENGSEFISQKFSIPLA